MQDSVLGRKKSNEQLNTIAELRCSSQMKFFRGFGGEANSFETSSCTNAEAGTLRQPEMMHKL